jgi:hypothetical protein
LSGAFHWSRLILCEGIDDDAFLKALLIERKLPKCHIVYTRTDRKRSGGNTKFGLKLKALRASSERNFDVIKKIMIVSDNDKNHTTSFQAICNQINEHGFGPAPTAELEPSVAPVPITIAMLPKNQEPGCLECVCIHAARRKKKIIAGHVDTFRDLVGGGGDDWEENRRGKMWLRSWLAVACEKDPFIPLQNVFADPKLKKLNLLPLNDGAFTPLARAISDFAS